MIMNAYPAEDFGRCNPARTCSKSYDDSRCPLKSSQGKLITCIHGVGRHRFLNHNWWIAPLQDFPNYLTGRWGNFSSSSYNIRGIYATRDVIP